MRRLPVFVVLGPLFSWLVFLAILLLDGGSMVEEGGQIFVASLFVSYGITLLPLIGIAYLDRRLAHYRWRVLVCALAGLAWATAFHYGLNGGEKEFQQSWLNFALVGGVPAALCSWLAGRYAP